MDRKIAKVNYNGFVRYWCFGEQFVEDVYDEVDGVVERNEEKAWIFDDMSRDELVRACNRDKYELTWVSEIPNV